MPSNNPSQIRGPPGPPGPRLGGPTKDSALWPRGPGGWGNDASDNQMGGGSGYGNPNSSGWGDIEPKRDPSGIWPDNGNSGGGWGSRPPRNPVGGPNNGGIRSSPGWGPGEDSPLDNAGNAGGWPVKPVGPMRTPGTDMSPSMMWQQSKPHRKLLEMGYNKTDVETALRSGNGSLEDALEILANAGRVPSMNKPDPMFGNSGLPDSGSLYDNPRGGGGSRFPPGTRYDFFLCLFHEFQIILIMFVLQFNDLAESRKISKV